MGKGSRGSRQRTTQKKTGKLMLVNYQEAEECRIAIVEQRTGLLEELFIERASEESLVGNIYKGVVTNVEPAIQAAFIDFGVGKNGFLHISDLHPRYFPSKEDKLEEVGKKISRQNRPPIQHCLKKGQEIICQVIRDGAGTKGPTLTTYISIPGRYLVMMPGMSKVGISRKIEDEQTRLQLKRIMQQLDLPKDMGFIVRTAGADRSKSQIKQDFNYLKRLWRTIQNRIRTTKAPAEIYKESDFVIRIMREIYSSDIKRIVVDNATVAQKIKDFIRIITQRRTNKVEVYNEKIPIFYRYGIEDQIVKICQRKVELPGGAFIVIDQVEGGVYIDVNSGSYREHDTFEQTAFEVNKLAANEIARQLRLRDIGGIIIIDFIDMKEEKHRREIEKTLRDAFKSDRTKVKMLRINAFGILELTRQKLGPSLESSFFTICPCCGGTGRIRTLLSISLDIMRLLQLLLYNMNIYKVDVKVSSEIAEYIHNKKKHTLVRLERETGKEINFYILQHCQAPDKYEIRCYDNRGREISLESVLGKATIREKHPQIQADFKTLQYSTDNIASLLEEVEEI